MPITVTTCHLCGPDVQNFFHRKRIPIEVRNIGRGRERLTVYCTSPTSWQEGSLAKMCWNRLSFSYHAAVRNGNSIKCSNC